MEKTKIIVIVGPTAVGKTALSIDVAKKFNGEIISGDSMQVYRTLDIGTAKATEEEMEGIPHYLIDIKDVTEEYSVSDFQKDAASKIKEIADKGRVPIVVGGTGLYIESLLYPVSHSKVEPNKELRSELEEYAQSNGNEALWDRLNNIDPKAAENIHHNNVRRVIRALEVFMETGQKFSSFQNEREKKESYFNPLIIGLNTDRGLLYERINQRVELMIEAGLIDEARNLWEEVGPALTSQSAKGIGYQELFPYFNGEISLEEATEAIKQNSRRYAKRQLTWFRNRFEDVKWFDLVQKPTDKEFCLRQIQEFLEGE